MQRAKWHRVTKVVPDKTGVSGFCDRASELCSFNKLKLVKPSSEVLKIIDKKQFIINSAC